MKKILMMSLLFLVGILSACSGEVDLPFIEEVDEVFTISYNGEERRYYVYVPSELEKNRPILFLLHGYGGTIEYFLESTDIKKLAERDKVIVVLPEGTPAVGLNHWDANLRYEEVDDVGFLSLLRNSLVEEYHVNEDHVFVGGHSNGGFMTYTLACEANDLFTAFMSVSGLMSGETWETCEGEVETNLLQFHGTDDDIVPIDGTMTELFGWGGAPPMMDMLQVWIDRLDNYEYSMNQVNELLTKQSYVSQNGTTLIYYEAEGYGHMWAKDGDLFDETNDLPDMTEILFDYLMSFVDE